MPGPERVFISYAHKDGRDLALRLQQDLQLRGFDVWLDRSRLKAGASWSKEIERALQQSDVVPALLSDGSFESEICRAEQRMPLDQGKCVIPILVERAVPRPLHLYTMQYLDFSDDASYAERLERLLEDIGGPQGASLEPRYSLRRVSPPLLPPSYVERPEALEALREAVIGEGTPCPIALTALRAMAGIGKTVLAQALCRDRVIQAAFPDGVVWVTVGQYPRDLTVQMREIAKALGGPAEGYDTVAAGAPQLRALLCDKAVLLVFDYVWDARRLEPFRAEAPRCRLLFTTRDARIATVLGAHEHSLDVLSGEQARELLAGWSQQPQESLPTEAGEVVRECGRLPLALAMVGAMVRGKPDRWGNVLDKLRHADLDKLGRQFPGYPHPNLLAALQVSVDTLDPRIRECYLDLAVFPEDTPVPEAALRVLWDLDEYQTQDTVDELVDRSLAQRDASGRLTLHDLQLDYVRRQVGEGALPALHVGLLERYAARCPRGWATGPDAGYFFQHLAYHLARAGRRAELRGLLLDFKWLQARLAHADAHALAADYDFMHEDAELRLVQGTTRLSAHILARDRSQLAGQLLGRLLRFDSAGIKALVAQAAGSSAMPWLRPLRPCLSPPGQALVMTLAGHTPGVRGAWR